MTAGFLLRAGLALIAVLAGGPAFAAGEKEDPFVIHRIAVDPGDSQNLYAITGNMGVLKSADGGATWSLSNAGLRSFTHRALAADTQNPGVVYVGGWGGGVSRSEDRGATWSERNDRLNNTAIESLALDPKNRSGLYAATTTGVYSSMDEGRSWAADSAGQIGRAHV